MVSSSWNPLTYPIYLQFNFQTLQNEGIGYDDLDELFRDQCDLIFTIENLSIELPEDYEKESWQLNEDEKLKTVEDYRIRGKFITKIF